MHPLWDPDVQRACLQGDAPVVVGFRRPQRDLPGSAGEGILDVKQHLGVMILAARLEVRALAGSKAVWASCPTEQLGEEVREIGCLARRKALAGELEAGVPVGWWAELLASLVATPCLLYTSRCV